MSYCTFAFGNSHTLICLITEKVFMKNLANTPTHFARFAQNYHSTVNNITLDPCMHNNRMRFEACI